MNKIPIKRIIIYIILAILSLFIVFLFVTAKTYTQLGIAVITYPILAFLIMKAIPRKTRKVLSGLVSQQPTVQPSSQSTIQAINNEDVVDVDKRTFLKLVGATGIFFFITSLLGKWLGTIPFNQSSPSLNNSKSVDASQETGSFSTNGYTITEIDEGIVSYYGFTNKDGAWLIMKQDSDSNSFRYAKGETSFPINWKDRATMKYDYYYNLE